MTLSSIASQTIHGSWRLTEGGTVAKRGLISGESVSMCTDFIGRNSVFWRIKWKRQKIFTLSHCGTETTRDMRLFDIALNTVPKVRDRVW